MNTKIGYMYRDGSNYKQYNEVIIAGTLTQQEKNDIVKALDEGQYFIPSQVGLCDLQERMIAFPNDDDHVWHELNIKDITETENEPTINHCFDHVRELAAQFKKVKWNIEEAMKENGL